MKSKFLGESLFVFYQTMENVIIHYEPFVKRMCSVISFMSFAPVFRWMCYRNLIVPKSGERVSIEHYSTCVKNNHRVFRVFFWPIACDDTSTVAVRICGHFFHLFFPDGF